MPAFVCRGSGITTVRHSVIDLRTVSETQLALWFSQMDAEKQGRVERLRRAEDRARSVCADHLARLLLTQVSGGTSLRFDTGENGKPTVLNCPWQFNLSHSGYFAACAVSEAPVGIDIEQLRPIRPALMRRVCTEQELRYVGEDSGRFLQLWTAKEAAFKQISDGTCAFIPSKLPVNGAGVSVYKIDSLVVSVATPNPIDLFFVHSDSNDNYLERSVSATKVDVFKH